MSLDQQRNWDAAMADTSQRTRATQKRTHSPQARAASEIDLPHPPIEHSTIEPSKSRPWLHLPDEIIVLILEYLVDSQSTLAACCYLSRQWHEAALPYLYARPQLYGRAYELFARTVCPSINLHVRKSPLSTLVKDLDLARLVHQGSKSMTARLLGRTKNTIEYFKAPQSSFAINCLPALAKCINLCDLDLSLVSESPPLPELLKSIANLEKLESLRLPRSAGYGGVDVKRIIRWPPRLKSLSLSGGIDNHFLRGELQFPQSLRHLTIEHCPHLSSAVLAWFLAEFIRPLPCFESIKIAHMPRFDEMAMNDLLYILPQVRKVSVSIDHITKDFFSGGNVELWSTIIGKMGPRESPCIPLKHEHLRMLEISSSGSPDPVGKIDPMDLLSAIDDEHLPALRIIRVAQSLGWQDHVDVCDDITAELQASNATDHEERTGIFKEGNMSTETWKKADPDASSGLWVFDG